MNIKLLEDKLNHCQESLNFVARQLTLFKYKSKNFPQNRFTMLDKVIYWTCDYHYDLCEILEIALHEDEPRYYLRRKTSTLSGDYKHSSEFWTKESNLFANKTELYNYLCKRLKILLDDPKANISEMQLNNY